MPSDEKITDGKVSLFAHGAIHGIITKNGKWRGTMSIDKLQQKIRKLKNPSIIDFTVLPEQIPPHLLDQEGSLPKAYGRFCRELLHGLKETVPAVRFHLGAFALLGAEGMEQLHTVMKLAKQQGYYVLLDAIENLSPYMAQAAARTLTDWPCDGIVVSACIGSDGLKPYIAAIKDKEKSLFVVLRTANRSASELQDLMTGSRLVYMAAADIVSRLGEPLVGRCDYSQIAGVGAANGSESLHTLRSKYSRMFLLVDGYDYTNANGKSCSYAFDKLGHGAVVCAGSAVAAAWTEANAIENDYVALAVEAAKRMQKNLLRYITIL